MMGMATATRTTDPEARTGLFRPPLPTAGPTSDWAPDNRTTGGRGIRWTPLLRDLIRQARELAADPAPPPAPPAGPAGPTKFDRVSRVILTDEVNRTLFGEYAAHRATDRGDEETGWVLLGVRDADTATVLATLPAGADRDAGEAHVRFNSAAQAVASRVVRQRDRRLTMVGVVHTHPGSLRHPSRGDYKGDREWVKRLRGGEGVFGIGTADAEPDGDGTPVGSHPHPNTQCLGGLRFSWYTLAGGDKNYREAPVELAIGPDLARDLRPVWPQLERHAERLDRLAHQLARVRFEVVEGKYGPALAVVAGLADPGHAVRVVLDGPEARFVYEAGESAFQADPGTPAPDEGVYRILAELAARS
jgi:proteasome lid subunit RPN8/RPN11